jgi:chorismate mutase
MKFKQLNITRLASANTPFTIAGPCSAESREQLMETALQLGNQGVRIIRAGIWKPRTKPGGFEGVGEKGLEWLRELNEQTGLLPTVEVANASHLRQALAAKIDILWIGARTSANPFAVQEIADALKKELTRPCMSSREVTLLVKNPVNPDPELWIGAMERIALAGVSQVGAIHRGFSTYERGLMRNTPHWNIPIELKRRMPELTMLCDPSHIGGRRDLIYSISQSALDMGFDGLMVESHIDPDKALSDSMQQITPEVLGRILKVLEIRHRDNVDNSLEEFRREIDELDERLLELLSKRMAISRDIGRYKKVKNIPVLQPIRYDKIINLRLSQAEELMLDSDFIKLVLAAIHEESVRQQLEIFSPRSQGE